jgi:hypothetical protein
LPGLIAGAWLAPELELGIEDAAQPTDELLALQDATPGRAVRLNADMVDASRAGDPLAIWLWV